MQNIKERGQPILILKAAAGNIFLESNRVMKFLMNLLILLLLLALIPRIRILAIKSFAENFDSLWLYEEEAKFESFAFAPRGRSYLFKVSSGIG